MNLHKFVNEIQDFPKKGINFKDINPLYRNPKAWKNAVDSLRLKIRETKPNLIAGIEARGFIIGTAIANSLDIGFIPIRKSNKLPGRVQGIDYQLEYGNDRLEIQSDSLSEDIRVLIIDDLLATGGTANAAGKLIINSGAILVGYGFIVELEDLGGRNKLNKQIPTYSLIKY